MHFSTLTMKYQKEKLNETIPFTITLKRIKYLGINLPKEAKLLSSKKYKMLMKEIKYDTDDKIYHVLQLEESILLKDYTTQGNLQFNAIPIKLPKAFFTELEEKQFLICMETQKTLNSQSNLVKEKNRAGGIRFPGFRLHYKATVIKTVWYWHKNRHRDQWNRIESTDIKPSHLWSISL